MNTQELRTLYGTPSGRAAIKVLTALEQHSRNFIEQSPFLILSSCNSQGHMDTSPRGGANITNDAKYFEMFPNETRPPQTCILIKIEELFLHCAKALMRSKLWTPENYITRSAFPTMGKMD